MNLKSNFFPDKTGYFGKICDYNRLLYGGGQIRPVECRFYSGRGEPKPVSGVFFSLMIRGGAGGEGMMNSGGFLLIVYPPDVSGYVLGIGLLCVLKNNY